MKSSFVDLFKLIHDPKEVDLIFREAAISNAEATIWVKGSKRRLHTRVRLYELNQKQVYLWIPKHWPDEETSRVEPLFVHIHLPRLSVFLRTFVRRLDVISAAFSVPEIQAFKVSRRSGERYIVPPRVPVKLELLHGGSFPIYDISEKGLGLMMTPSEAATFGKQTTRTRANLVTPACTIPMTVELRFAKPFGDGERWRIGLHLTDVSRPDSARLADLIYKASRKKFESIFTS